MADNHIVYISLGSNMGNRLLSCRKGLDAFAASGLAKAVKCSTFCKTEPVDFTDQDWFVNAVAEIETTFEPFHLLRELQAIQHQAGRTKDTVRYGPRILDLDILLYDDFVLDDPLLVIPHPRMHKRRFVLTPICDINSDIVHPVIKKNMRELLDSLDESGQRVIVYSC